MTGFPKRMLSPTLLSDTIIKTLYLLLTYCCSTDHINQKWDKNASNLSKTLARKKSVVITYGIDTTIEHSRIQNMVITCGIIRFEMTR